MARILLVEDQPVVRSGIRALFEQSGEHTVIGEASTATEAVDLAESLKPEMIVMDIGLGEESGISALRRIRQLDPTARVLMLSVYREAQYVSAAFSAGALGYVLKWSAPSVLLQAVEAVSGGGRAIDPELVGVLISEPPRPRLSPREREILGHVAGGLSTKEIAARLNLSVKTIETHRQHIMDKLDIHDVAGLVRYAMREGIVEP